MAVSYSYFFAGLLLRTDVENAFLSYRPIKKDGVGREWVEVDNIYIVSWASKYVYEYDRRQESFKNTQDVWKRHSVLSWVEQDAPGSQVNICKIIVTIIVDIHCELNMV